MEQLVLFGAVLATLIVLVACVPILSFQLELWRVGREYDLSKDESALYARELPDVHRAIELSLGPGASSREVRRMARESIIAAILRQRERRGRAPLAAAAAIAAEQEALAREEAAAARTVISREDLVRGRRRG